jgi:hypothetical protein
MSEYEKNIDDVKRVDVDGGYFEYLEYPSVIFVTHLKAEKRGKGPRVMRALLDYAKQRNKTIWGEINQREPGMDNDRLRRWYELMGGVVVGRLNDNNLIQQRTLR